MKQTARVRPCSRVRIVEAIRGGDPRAASRRQGRIPGEVAVLLRRQRHRQNGGFVLVKHRNIPGGEEKGTVLTVINVRNIDRSAKGSPEVVVVDLRLEERPA